MQLRLTPANKACNHVMYAGRLVKRQCLRVGPLALQTRFPMRNAQCGCVRAEVTIASDCAAAAEFGRRPLLDTRSDDDAEEAQWANCDMNVGFLLAKGEENGGGGNAVDDDNELVGGEASSS